MVLLRRAAGRRPSLLASLLAVALSSAAAAHAALAASPAPQDALPLEQHFLPRARAASLHSRHFRHRSATKKPRPAANATVNLDLDLDLDLNPNPDNDVVLAKRDASTLKSGGNNPEGELHTPLTVPKGAYLTALPVGSGKDQAVVYWSKRSDDRAAEQAFVMIHGRIRNGNDYWTTMENALVTAVNDGFPGASNNSIVTAPQYFSTKYNAGQYNSTELAWGDVNAWQAGEIATHPAGTTSSSFDVLDAFVAEFSNKSKYPNLKNITLVGHGGGGQLMQRYAVVGRTAPAGVHVRYIYGDPSSSLYFTTDRPDVDASIATKANCPWYNTWRYGFSNFTDVKPSGGLSPIQYFARYTRRDVVSMIGFQDVDASGDQYCMAKLQGGNKRRDRNLAYWKYINTLARTNFDLTGFNATYHNLPDWSNVTGHSISHRLVVIEQADHDANLVFGSSEGRSALFSSGSMPTGWRPQGWNPRGTGKYHVSSVHASPAGGTLSGSSSPTASSSSSVSSAAASQRSSARTIHSFTSTASSSSSPGSSSDGEEQSGSNDPGDGDKDGDNDDGDHQSQSQQTSHKSSTAQNSATSAGLRLATAGLYVSAATLAFPMLILGWW